MKPLRDQNYYEILEIPYGATRGEIQRAYELARLTYARNSVASYSLFKSSELDEILNKIEEAYRTLIDPQKREAYDVSLREKIGEMPPRREERIPLQKRDLPEPYLSQQEITGKELKKLREQIGLSLPEIAEKTRISISYLLYLEEDNLRSLPPETYLRSYLTQYVSVLGLDPKQVSDRYFAYFRRNRR
jgi:flagellar biosynthesis protein FlhG